MLNLFRKSSSQKLTGPIQSLVFFILFYLYLWLEVDLRLIYHGGGMITNFPVFYRGWSFFHQFIPYPGGPVEYLSSLLSQFFYYSWAGALIVTLQAWLICVCTGYSFKALNSPFLSRVRFIPPILLLIIYNQYTYYFTTTVALSVALLFVCLYLRVMPTGRLVRLVVFPVLSVILYYIAGGACLLFAVLCAIYELLFSRRWKIGLLYLLSALLIPYVEGVLVFGTGIIDAFTELSPFSHKLLSYETRNVIIVHILYILLPLTAIGLGVWRLFLSGPALLPDKPNPPEAAPDLTRGKKKVKEKLPSKSSKSGAGIFSWVIESSLLFVIAGIAVFLSYDIKLKTLFAVDYYACHKMWPQVLQAAHHYQSSPLFFIVNAVNRALYHTGRLGHDMFSYPYPQHPDALFLPDKQHIPPVYWKKFDIYIDLGHMNLAEHNLLKSLGAFEARPMILKRLAMINMVKGNIADARIYLGALSKTLFYADWANNYLDRTESDPNLSTDEHVQRLRGLVIDKDYTFGSFVYEDVLLALLEENRQNHTAFEYLMALYLLTKQLDKFAQNLDRLDDFDYPEIPRLYEEAILIYQSTTRRKVDLKGRQISWQTYQRSNDFGNICRSFHRSDKRAMIFATARDFADSYFFYYNFGP